MGSRSGPKQTVEIETVTLVCDGCGAEGRTDMSYDWAVDAAWDDGWRQDEDSRVLLCAKCLQKAGA